MFDTAYFNVSPFGSDDPTAQTTNFYPGIIYFLVPVEFHRVILG
jgi:hypothetical protein